MANAKHLRKLKQGVTIWNAWKKKYPKTIIDLRGADLSEADLSEADLRRAHLSEAHLSGAYLYGAGLIEADISGADLRGAHLSGADLREAHLREADLREADLSTACLHDANLDGAMLTDACLWETQRAGWSIQGVLCETIYWDRNGRERTTYSPGEFERLYAYKTKVVLQYAGGIISPIEIATLPAMIEIMQKWSDCVLRLDSLQDAPGGATVTLVIEDSGKRDSAQTETLKEELERLGQRTIEAQKELIQERGQRLRLEGALDYFRSTVLSPIMEHVMEKSQKIEIKGDVYGPVGQISGGEYTFNDLVVIKNLVDEIFNHRVELSLESEKQADLESSLQTVQAQFATQAPNPSLLRETLHTIRHILEAGAAHVAVQHWQPIWHALQRLTGG